MAFSNYISRIKKLVAENQPEAFASAAAFVGWVLVTLALVLAFSAPWIWFMSAGLLILGCVGFRLLARVMYHGLYLPWLEELQESQRSQ